MSHGRVRLSLYWTGILVRGEFSTDFKKKSKPLYFMLYVGNSY
jgi:hypothetical protein